MRTILHHLNRLVILILKYILYYIPKDNKLILFSAWFGQKYADSSMYMYEYLLKDGGFKPVWYTRNKDIYKQLKSENKPVVYSNSIKGIWTHIRAKVLVSSIQFQDFNGYLLSNCILFDLDHGYALKQVHFKQLTCSKRQKDFEFLLRKKMQYYMSASSLFIKNTQNECYEVDDAHMVFCNKPRTDVFWDEELRKGLNPQVEKLKKCGKVIVWMPTHRSDGQVKLEFGKMLNLDKVEQICEEIGAYLIIKKHFYHRNENLDLSKYTRIVDYTNEKIDIQTLLYQADVMISDYSSTYIEYLLMNRPIILFAFDLENYLKTERDVFVPFSQNNVGYKPTTPEEFYAVLKKLGDDWNDTEHLEGRESMRKMYFDDEMIGKNCRPIVKEIIQQLIDGTYHFDWSNLS